MDSAWRKEALAVTVGGINIARMGDMSVTEAIEFVESLELSEKEHIIADRILKEIKARLGFLKNVGTSVSQPLARRGDALGRRRASV